MMEAPGPEDARIHRLEQASLWLQRMHKAGQDDGVVEAWLDWCQSDPLNQQAFDDVAAVWEDSAALAQPRAGQSASRSRMPRRALAASLAGLAVTLLAGIWWLLPSGDAVASLAFSSPTGVNTVHRLPDGSALDLAAGSRVSVTIGKRERRVELHEGELFVTVHPDSSRPFVVDAGQLEVIATGTAFDVLRTAERTTVTVTEGSVITIHEDRAESAPNVHLRSGQQLVYSYATLSVDVREVDHSHASGWRSGTVYFSSEPLSEVIETLNRYTHKRIVIESDQLRAEPFTGTARTTQIDAWLRALPHAFAVDIVELADGRRRIEPRTGAGTH